MSVERITPSKRNNWKFNTYRFLDYKERVIDLLMRVTTVSVKTMRIVGEMEGVEGTN